MTSCHGCELARLHRDAANINNDTAAILSALFFSLLFLRKKSPCTVSSRRGRYITASRPWFVFYGQNKRGETPPPDAMLKRLNPHTPQAFYSLDNTTTLSRCTETATMHLFLLIFIDLPIVYFRAKCPSLCPTSPLHTLSRAFTLVAFDYVWFPRNSRRLPVVQYTCRGFVTVRIRSWGGFGAERASIRALFLTL